MIPALIRKCVEARDRGDDHIVVWGDGTPTREFLYVEDCAKGIVYAAERYNGGQPVNLGSGREISITDLVRLIAKLTGFAGVTVWDTTKPNGQPRRCLDVSAARSVFGFIAETSFDVGLQRTVDDYLAGYGRNVPFEQSPVSTGFSVGSHSSVKASSRRGA